MSSPFDRLFARGSAWMLIAGCVAVVSTTGCWSYQISTGTFELTATGGLAGRTDGSAQAAHETFWSGAGYRVVLDVARGSQPIAGLPRLVFWTQARPRSTNRFTIVAGPASDAKQQAGAVLTVADQLVRWLADSGTVNYRVGRTKSDVSGDFIVFASCSRCRRDSTSYAVIRGSFQTH